jgi:hypothetical protein
MKDNARHFPGSTPSRGTPFSRSTALPGRSLIHTKSTYKTQTKCRQNRKCDFFIVSASTIYGFSAVNCLHFCATDRSPLARGDGKRVGQTCFLLSPSPHHPISPSAALPVRSSASCRLCVDTGRQLILYTGQNETFETETGRSRRVFLTNLKTFLRPVSFCPAVGRAVPRAPHSCRLVSIVVSPKMGNNETNPKTKNTDPLRRRHLRQHRRISSHFGKRAGGPKTGEPLLIGLFFDNLT